MTDQYADDLSDEDTPPAAGGMVVAAGLSDKQIEKTFETGRLRVVQEKNDLFLSHVIQFIGGSGEGIWSNLRPEYQRRLRWDVKKKSKLIESFIMNIPVPPVFLYEKDLGRFEVMDGQQRLNTIAEFFGNKFSLEGLDIWEALNGRNYSTLPPLVRRGLDRAKISAITLMSDNSSPKEDSIDLRAQVFDRLNRGGERLNQQELRNSLYSGSFNSLLISLSGLPAFTDAWDIPSHKDNTLADDSLSPALVENPLFKRMADVEIVLRFFAFRGPKKLSGSVRSMLDETMKEWRHFSQDKQEEFEAEFKAALSLCIDVYREDTFRLPRQNPGKPGRLSRPLYDAEMIAMFHLREYSGLIKAKRDSIRPAVLALAAPSGEKYDLMVGRGNTATTIEERISTVESVIREIIDV
ncbi:MAG: DUF262 domain-containing protein [Phenylobacterium sp.]|uniref:DUF262 domain-containing protein n=1 Tax=Phenylobacterium sp. TaxID=1871053 RepID=UPI0025D4CE7C|nr:DUF262 domain-containing protein [Phenylobacterium sp.]MBI1196520.1 DUF262 domain-containing protein [Phenylobacterium sp.]